MMQLDIFAPPQTLARRSDPETSHKAAERVAEFANGHHEQIVGVLRKHGCIAHKGLAQARLHGARLQRHHHCQTA